MFITYKKRHGSDMRRTQGGDHGDDGDKPQPIKAELCSPIPHLMLRERLKRLKSQRIS